MAPAQPKQCTPLSWNAPWRTEGCWASVFDVASGSIPLIAITPLKRFEHPIVLLLEELSSAGKVGGVGLPFAACVSSRGSLQAMVVGLGDREEGLVACNQLPVGQDTQTS